MHLVIRILEDLSTSNEITRDVECGAVHMS